MKTKTKFGGVEIGGRPKVVATVGGKWEESLAAARIAFVNKIELLEVRADFCLAAGGEENLSEVLSYIRSMPGHATILTIRKFSEGGVLRSLTEDDRFAIYEKLLPLADAVDIEFGTELESRVIELAHKAGKGAIVSYHNFDRTPSASGSWRDEHSLDDIVRLGISLKADVIKIAAMAQNYEDVERLVAYTSENGDRANLATISLGDIGAASRLVTPMVGSVLTYGHAGRIKGDPDQLHVKDLRVVMEAIDENLFDLSEAKETLVHLGESGWFCENRHPEEAL